MFKRLKNREDGSDFDDFWTKNNAATRPNFWKIFERTSSLSWHRRRHRRRRRRRGILAASITEPLLMWVMPIALDPKCQSNWYQRCYPRMEFCFQTSEKNCLKTFLSDVWKKWKTFFKVCQGPLFSQRPIGAKCHVTGIALSKAHYRDYCSTSHFEKSLPFDCQGTDFEDGIWTQKAYAPVLL